MICTQIIGLPEVAKDFLECHVESVPGLVCPKCGEVITFVRNSRVYASASEAGMFDDGPELEEYVLKSGNVVREKIQCVVWSSGPCIFLKLVDVDDKVLYEWKDYQIEKAI